MKTIETKVYEYHELPTERAKEKARRWFLECQYQDSWWAYTYEDAKDIGLKITSFDLDRNRHAKGEFITYAEDCAKSILKTHGEDCATYATAAEYLESLKALQAKFPNEEDSFDDELSNLNDEFLRSILEDYSIILRRESEYMQSEEYLIEGIEMNEYTFTEDGKRFD